MVDIVKKSAIIITAHFVSADNCFYDDGTRFGKIVPCDGGCCGTSSNPCCPDAGSIMAITTGAIICILIVLVCVVACCIHSFKSKGNFASLGPRVPEIRSISNEFHEFNTLENGQVVTPPRYSDLYPKANTSEPASIDRTRPKSEGNRSLTSINRNSGTRRGIKRGPSSASIQSDPAVPRQTNNTADFTQQRHQRRLSNCSIGRTVSSNEANNTNEQRQENGDGMRNNSDSSRAIENNDRSSFMSSIVTQLPKVFDNGKIDE